MFKQLIKLFLTLTFMVSAFCNASSFPSPEKIYIDAEDFQSNIEGDEFYLHVGENVWFVTHTLHRDSSGMFAYDYYIKRSLKEGKREYERKWKCPYCYNYWPIGTPCQKADCPSRYR